MTKVDVRGAHVSVVEFPPGLRLGMHRHERACITLVLTGRFDERFPGREIDCRPGSLLAKPAGEPHADRFSTDGSRQVIIEPDLATDEALEPTAPLFQTVRSACGTVYGTLARRIAREVMDPDDVSALALEALLLDTLATGARLQCGAPSGAAPAWLRRARDVIHDSPGRAPALRAIASEVGVHPAHLARSFSAWFGTTVGEYARHLKIESAAQALACTDLSLARIGARAGFADQSHFTRTFKRYTGLTPLQYRRRIRATPT